MPMKCISVMGLLTVQQLQAQGGNSLQKPVTVKCFFVSEERLRELVGGGPEGGELDPAHCMNLIDRCV